MATAQKQKNSVSAVVFPNKISTEQQSLMLVKRLLAVAVSCITYLRGIFPESAYGTRYMDDLCVKILREDKNCPGSTQLVKWMLGCYDALQKKYLRMVVLAVYTHPEDPQTITECYHFKFKYTHNGPLLDFSSKNKKNDSTITCADTKKASILLIRKIYVLMQSLSPLPNDVCLTMKLFYYDEVTPSDYQPPGFKEGECEGMIFEGEPMQLNVGEVPTPFHMLKVKVTTEKQRMENVDKGILKDGDTHVPHQVLRVDGDDPEDENQDMDEDSVLENKVEDGNNADVSEAQEIKHAALQKELNVSTLFKNNGGDVQDTARGDRGFLLGDATWLQNWDNHRKELQDTGKCSCHPENLRAFPQLEEPFLTSQCALLFNNSFTEPNLACEEDGVLKAGGNQTLYVSSPQVDHLASKTSELNMSESRTRSGKIFQSSTCHQFEPLSSQDVLPKRRKISEPKERF